MKKIIIAAFSLILMSVLQIRADALSDEIIVQFYSSIGHPVCPLYRITGSDPETKELYTYIRIGDPCGTVHLKEGSYVIPPFEIKDGNRTYISLPVLFSVDGNMEETLSVWIKYEEEPVKAQEKQIPEKTERLPAGTADGFHAGVYLTAGILSLLTCILSVLTIRRRN